MPHKQFQERAKSVAVFLRSLQSLENNYRQPGRSFYSATSAITASRASAFIMIYNCVEFATRTAIISLRVDILSNAKDFGAVREYWQQEIVRAHFHHRLTQGTNHIEFLNDVTRFMPGSLDWRGLEESTPFPGNVDHDAILKLIRRIEYKWTPPRSCLGGSDLQLVRKMRNDLAHGHETFESVGARYTTQDIIDKFNRIKIFMNSFIKRIDRYRTKQLYLR
ncbi:MAE_28990/MAE_18760 family HEPN-like nuclease [Bauldia litoralis]|uniref:MAE-28990/MAE-18760-like HEPN domain-containing protein n=1 Tax=Bauldia litoralis TaxID=665467 RepID=A0A1G6DVR6_9HYPH|nr:hypothetical protein SAMN02982931_03856 [Bauldia litoralis]